MDFSKRRPWEPCFLAFDMYEAPWADQSPAWTEELCPFCTLSHLTEVAHRIVTTWLQLQPPAVREIALALGPFWEGSWLDLQIASLQLAEGNP